MKPAKKTYVLFCLVALIAVACGPVTPVAPETETTTIGFVITSTPTETLTPRPTVVSSPTPFLPSVWKYLPPAFGPVAYKLKPWTEGDYVFFVNSMNTGELFDSYPSHLPVFDSFYGYDYLLHTDQVNIDSDLVWTLAQMSPMGVPLPGMRMEEDYFNFLIEKLLNDAKVSFTDLRSTLKRHGFGVTNTHLVKDFYGKDDDAFFFDVVDENGYLNIGAVFAVRFVNGAYQVHTLADWNWMFGLGTGREYSFKDVVDTNHNGLPELVIEEYEGHSGSPPSSKITISLNEWDAQNKTYRINSFTIFNSHGCRDHACDGNWRVNDAKPNSIPTLVIQEKYLTQANCPELTIQRTYRWDGREYPLEEEVILPPVSNRVECQIAWAETVIRTRKHGWQNDRAIQIISDALHDWPEAMDRDWGPSSRDYFRLRLGIWKDFRGESTEAVKLLEPLAANSFVTDYSLPSQTASAYLQGRKGAEIVSACQKANEIWNSVIEPEIYSPYGYELTETARQLLGFTNERWGYSIDHFSFICPENDAIFATSRNLTNSESVNPAKWFTGFGRSVYMAKQDDFNSDGMQDWLIVAQASKAWPFSTEWFFFGNLNGFDPYEFDALFDGSPSNSWRVLHPDKESEPVYLVHTEESSWVFRVNRDKQIETLLDDYGVTLLQIDQSDGIKIKVSATDWDYKGEKIKNYVWDAPSQTFVTVIEEYDFEGTRQHVERMIFQEHDYASAISSVQQFLAESPVEYLQVDYCVENKCEYDPETYYPSMYYMMAIAYEMSGQFEQAARTYYFLWRDYPDSPYALLAQYKLEPTNP